MQLIGLYSFSSTPIFVHLLCMKWLIDNVSNDFAEKANIALLMSLIIEHKRPAHLSILSLKTCIHVRCIYHKKDKTFTSWPEDFSSLERNCHLIQCFKK